MLNPEQTLQCNNTLSSQQENHMRMGESKTHSAFRKNHMMIQQIYTGVGRLVYIEITFSEILMYRDKGYFHKSATINHE